MIRRREGSKFWLIAQHEHARLSGVLAAAVGGPRMATPSPEAVAGVTLHDCGWPLHDDSPTLSPTGQPLDVFESPRHVSLRVWLESARRAAKVGPYQGLLVSLHQLALSAISATQNATRQFDDAHLRHQFDLNKFQHAVIEHLEHLRPRVGLRTDRPLRLGLADGWTDDHEEVLKFDFKLLQAMDQLSLAVCCTKPPHRTTFAFYDRPGGETLQLNVVRPNPGVLLVSPWPFRESAVECDYAYRAIAAKTYDDEAAFRDEYAAASESRQRVVVRPA